MRLYSASFLNELSRYGAATRGDSGRDGTLEGVLVFGRELMVAPLAATEKGAIGHPEYLLYGSKNRDFSYTR